MSQIWFTSDTHFGHKDIVYGYSSLRNKKRTRGFTTIEEHDNYLIEQINKHVLPYDVLYHLGDFAFGTTKELIHYRKQINCKKIYLIKGNHDSYFGSPKNYENAKKFFLEISSFMEKPIRGLSMVLCHYAMRTWNGKHTGDFHLYGHSHGGMEDIIHERSLDVGVDTSLYGHEKYTPYSLDEIVRIMINHKIYSPSKHKSYFFKVTT